MNGKRSNEQGWRCEFQRLEGAYAPSTMRSYRADVEAFEHWCSENGITRPLPATVETVCEFLEDEGKSKAPSIVQRRLYAIWTPAKTPRVETLIVIQRQARGDWRCTHAACFRWRSTWTG